jgi:hypothetical protein
MKTSKPEVFIVESLTFEDEWTERFEGRIIKQILALSGKRCEYYYIRTAQELREVLKLFDTSRYRYLHLSCHGNAHSMATTLDSLEFDELAQILSPHLNERRLFVSACSMTNRRLASQLMSETGCYSILGPDEDIGFGDAAILWASLYHTMFAADRSTMKRSILRAKAQEVSNMFRVRLRYFTRSSADPQGFEQMKIHPEAENTD